MSNGEVNYQNSCSGAVKEPILSREEVERAWAISNGMVRRDNVSEDQLVAFASALESALLEKLCGEPIYQIGDGNELWRDVEKNEFDSAHHARIVYALNRSKA